MRPAAAASPEALELVGLLERAIHDGARAAVGVPAALWSDALLDPLREFLCRPSKGVRGRLLELGFRVGAGTGAPPRELPLLVEVLHAGSLIIDDIEDNSASRRGAFTVHRRYGVPVALNAGNWLYFWAQVLLGRAALDDAARLEAYRRLAQCLMRSHEGQALDLTVRVDELSQADVPEVVQAITRLKTGACSASRWRSASSPRVRRPPRAAPSTRSGAKPGLRCRCSTMLSGLLNPRRRVKVIEDLRLGRATSPGSARPAVARATAAVVERADAYYRSGDAGLRHLAPRCAFAVRTARLVYSRIGERVRAQGCDPLAGRAVVSGGRKAAAAARAALVFPSARPARFRAAPRIPTARVDDPAQLWLASHTRDGAYAS